VYYISRGKVKPANKAFAAVRNDYTINLDNGYLLSFDALSAMRTLLLVTPGCMS
jgi:hypothetical protein